MSEVPLETLLEATLFSAGRSMNMVELSEQLGYDEEEITEAISNLQATVKRRRGGGLQVVEIGGKWAMEVKPIIANHLPKETKSELAPKLLKAASLIAYHQPMPQSRLVELLGHPNISENLRVVVNLLVLPSRLLPIKPAWASSLM